MSEFKVGDRFLARFWNELRVIDKVDERLEYAVVSHYKDSSGSHLEFVTRR